MANGFKTGGRLKDTPNKVTRDVIERLTELSCDPIEGMAGIAADPKSSPELRGRMYAELAQYVYPKRKAIEVGGIDGAPDAVALTITFVRPAKIEED
jgi:hypothetical protein